ncbi:hypothetical protein PS689_05433 [Pseudomonas fluorescens]|nr:hypothetical protein PS689_05433 [Pseudomonas fluorescens]
MQLAILLVLILIAVILAPWLLWVVFAGAFAYGTALVATAAVALVFFLIFAFKDKLKSFQSRSRVDAQIRAANEIIRQKDAEREASIAMKHARQDELETKSEAYTGRRRVCAHCQVEIMAGSLYCPSCGKQPKPLAT